MSDNPSGPDLMSFARWLAAKIDERGIADYARQPPSASLVAAARRARDEFQRVARDLKAADEQSPIARAETLQLMAAADASESALPPELMTASGFRVTLANDLRAEPGAATLCILVQCPTALLESMEGQIACLSRGAERFELGQFDSEGKAIGTLPATVNISPSDFAQGNIRFEIINSRREEQ